MRAGFRGTFVISWSQTQLDGLRAPARDTLITGAAWRWSGEVVQVDGPKGLLRLNAANGEAELRRRAAQSVRRLVGAAVDSVPEVDGFDADQPLMDSHFVVTDGKQSYTVTLIEVGPNARPLLMFLDDMPPPDSDLWVVHASVNSRPDQHPGALSGSGVICFTPGTLISTPNGPIPIEAMQVGDLVNTRDNGAKEIVWMGQRRITGARMFVLPSLRPIRISAGALGIERPEQELLVSPEHRMLVRGRAARALFNTPEVLVAAGQLVNGQDIRVDLSVREVTYIHLLLPEHAVIWANNVETESFHPASADLSGLATSDRNRLLAQFPDVGRNPLSYGTYARRNLSDSEAAILMHEAA